MTFEKLMNTSQKLNVSVEALAVLAAKLRADTEDLTLDPAIAPLIDSVVAELGFSEDQLALLTVDQRRAVAGIIRSFFRQAADLIEQPDCPLGWRYDDPAILQSQGRASMALAPIIQQMAPDLGDLGERLTQPDAAFLDIGTGVGWLAVAMAQAFPGLRVVGIDIWKPALELAARNIEPMRDRISLREQSIVDLRDEQTFDAVFLPGPFLPMSTVATAVERALLALRPGGWLLFTLYAPIDDPLSASLTNLRVVRSGGHPWVAGEVVALLDRAGYTRTRAFERSWQIPVTFVVGSRPD